MLLNTNNNSNLFYIRYSDDDKIISPDNRGILKTSNWTTGILKTSKFDFFGNLIPTSRVIA